MKRNKCLFKFPVFCSASPVPCLNSEAMVSGRSKSSGIRRAALPPSQASNLLLDSFIHFFEPHFPFVRFPCTSMSLALPVVLSILSSRNTRNLFSHIQFIQSRLQTPQHLILVKKQTNNPPPQKTLNPYSLRLKYQF